MAENPPLKRLQFNLEETTDSYPPKKNLSTRLVKPRSRAPKTAPAIAAAGGFLIWVVAVLVFIRRFRPGPGAWTGAWFWVLIWAAGFICWLWGLKWA